MRVAVILATILFLSQCSRPNCEDSWECYPLAEIYEYTIPTVDSGDKIVFVNDDAQTLEFIVYRFNQSEELEGKCTEYGYGNCDCPPCRSARQFSATTLDQSRKVWSGRNDGNSVTNLWSLILKENDQGTARVFYSFDVLGFAPIGRIQIDPLLLDTNTREVGTQTFGGKKYFNVMSYALDSATYRDLRYDSYPYCDLVYFNLNNGIIAFRDLQTNTIFHLKE